MWQLSSMRLRIYSLFQKYRARSATCGSEMAERVPGTGFPAGARAGIHCHPKTQGALPSHTHPQDSANPLEETGRKETIWGPNAQGRILAPLHIGHMTLGKAFNLSASVFSVTVKWG